MTPLVSLSLLLALASSTATTSKDDLQAAQKLVEQASRAEAKGQLAEALGLFQKALLKDPSPSPLHKLASDSVTFLEPRSIENFQPYLKLQQMKSINALQLKPAEVEQFEQTVNRLPPGLVRQDSRAFIADAWLRLLHDPAKAVAAHQKWLAEPGLDSGQTIIAQDGLRIAQERLRKQQQKPPPVPPPTTSPARHRPTAGVWVAIAVAILMGLLPFVRRRRSQ